MKPTKEPGEIVEQILYFLDRVVPANRGAMVLITAEEADGELRARFYNYSGYQFKSLKSFANSGIIQQLAQDAVESFREEIDPPAMAIN